MSSFKPVITAIESKSSTMNQAKFYNPLQIELMDSANALQLQGSSSSSIWSPQQLTQSDINSSIYFSPGLVRRALVKTSTSSTSTNSSSLFSWPMSSISSQPRREVTDNNPPPVKPFNRTSQTPTLPRRSEKIDLSDVIANAQLQRSLGAPPKNCSFCRSNGEPEHIYTSHFLKVTH